MFTLRGSQACKHARREKNNTHTHTPADTVVYVWVFQPICCGGRGFPENNMFCVDDKSDVLMGNRAVREEGKTSLPGIDEILNTVFIRSKKKYAKAMYFYWR